MLFVSAVCVSKICMHDVYGGLVCIMCVGDLYAGCMWGIGMHDVCGALVCMMHMWDMYA